MPRSKRKSSESETTGKAKRRKESDGNGVLHDVSVFGQLISKAGFILKTADKPNQIKCDQVVFQKNLTKAIKRDANFQVAEFIEALSNHLEDSGRFFKALMPTLTVANCDTSSRVGNQDSLLRLLLGIDQIQPSIMSMLLEKLAEFTGDEEPIMDQNNRVNIPRLIMNQFRWLNNIVNSKEVTNKMLEIVCIVSPEVQHEIITCIPEVVDDSEHNTVAKELRDLLVENNQLSVPILDVLSNLILKPDLLAEVRGSVISSLPSVALDDLPVIVRFLLQTVSQGDALQVMIELRQHLDFHTSFPPMSSSTPNKSIQERHLSNPKTARGSEALTLDAIRSGIRFQRSLAGAWVKAIESLKTAADYKIVDVFVILILHQCGHKKAVESLVRNKVRAGHFTEVLLHAAFGAHTQVLREYFPAVLALAEVLLRSPEPSIFQFAAAMYRHAFVAFDAYCQQEIVGSLVTHIGSGFAAEIDISLDILSDLVETHTMKMAPFAIFVKGVLDYLDNLSMSQIRKLYAMLSTLAFRSTQGEGQIQDEMFIVIRKQLTNNDTRYKRMGVIGAIMVVQSLASSMDQSVMASQSSAELLSMPQDAYKQVVNLLQLVRASTNGSPEAAALFMDELSSVVTRGIIDAKVEDWVSEHVLNDFQDDYVVDIDPDNPSPEALLPMDVQYGLDEGEGAIAINLLPLVTKELTKSSLAKEEKQVSPMCLAPHFRLLQTCERRQREDTLEEIDALLGCPIYLPKTEVADKLGSLSLQEKHGLCHTLFYTINWYREVVNAFATQSDVEMKAKVIIRLQNITDVQALLQKCLPACHNYRPPAAVFDSPEPTVATSSGASGTSGVKRGKKPGKGKKKDQNKDNLDDTSEANNTTIEKSQLETQADKEKTKESEPNGISLSGYRGYLREFDMDVFTILHTGLITRAALDTEMNTKDTTPIQLQPPQLELLLDDLFHKLDHMLIASVTKRRNFLKSKGDRNCGFSHVEQLGAVKTAKYAVKLLPALCQHLEATSAFFQALIAENDGLIDGPGWNSTEAQQMASCFQLLIQILSTIFAWSGFVSPEHRDLLKEALGTTATRITSTAPSQPSFAELLKQTFQYVENFTGTVPNLAAAVTQIRLLTSLANRTDSQNLHSKISTLAEKFLKREWLGLDGEKLKGGKYNELIQHMLKMMLTHSDDVLGALESIATVGMAELLEAGKNGPSETYPTLTKNSFPVYLRVSLATLVVTIKDITPGRQSDATELKLDRLLKWNLAVRVFHILVNLIKAFDARSNLIAILKNGRQFVEIFLRLGMPLLDHMFRHHREDVQGLLKNLQLSTRVLHHMAGHSKIIRDVCLTNLVPPIKKVLEAFVYRVKAMLTLNRCLEAFWLGNLKNRDLKGGEILTQTTAESSKDSDSDEESLPADDDDSEVEVEDAEATDGPQSDNDQGSYSESY